MVQVLVQRVCVTGASGFIASHIVAQLLQKGYTVHATVRDPTNEEKVAHLTRLPAEEGQLKLFAATLGGEENGFAAAVAGCTAIIHTAQPMQPTLDRTSGSASQIIDPSQKGMKAICAACDSAGVKCMILTSSTAATNPKEGPPAVKKEEHYTDVDTAIQSGRVYPAAKVLIEHAAEEWARRVGARLAIILPTVVYGPMLQTPINGTMNNFRRMLLGRAFQSIPNDSMSFVDVRDCAAHHVAALENTVHSGRFFSVVESWHWKDIYACLKEAYPPLKLPPADYTEPDVAPTLYDTTRMETLGVRMRSLREIIFDSTAELRGKGYLDSTGRSQL